MCTIKSLLPIGSPNQVKKKTCSPRHPTVSNGLACGFLLTFCGAVVVLRTVRSDFGEERWVRPAGHCQLCFFRVVRWWHNCKNITLKVYVNKTEIKSDLNPRAAGGHKVAPFTFCAFAASTHTVRRSDYAIDARGRAMRKGGSEHGASGMNDARGL